MSKEILFYVLFNTGKSLHDRVESFGEDKRTWDFVQWVKDKRSEVEEKIGEAVVIQNMMFVKLEQGNGQHYGYYQLCPKCDGEGILHESTPSLFVETVTRTCPVCNGEKKLIRPEINHQTTQS